MRAGVEADLGLVDAHDGVDGDAAVDIGVDARVQAPVPVPATARASATARGNEGKRGDAWPPTWRSRVADNKTPLAVLAETAC